MREFILRFLVSTVCMCVMFGCSGKNQESMGVEVEPITISDDGSIEIKGFVGDESYTATVTGHPDYDNRTISDEDWPAEDWFLFVMTDESGKKVIKRSFRSSYGLFNIDFVDLDGDSTMEVVFITGEGRGTSVRRETLAIERFEGYGLLEVFSTSYSGFYGCGRGHWSYERRYVDTDGNGTTDLDLVLTHTVSGDWKSSWGLPKEKRKVIRWSGAYKGQLRVEGHR